jgi:hypothetical protein
MSPLRARMIEDIKLAGLAPRRSTFRRSGLWRIITIGRRRCWPRKEVGRYLLAVRERTARGSFKTNHYGIQFFYRNTLGLPHTPITIAVHTYSL